MASIYRPIQLWINRDVLESPITAHVRRALPQVPTAIVEGPPPVVAPDTQAARMTMSKKHLYLTSQQGRFIRPCPGASSRREDGRLCCGYTIVDVVSNCNYDCTYCYLQSYINTPYMTVYANIASLFDELAALLQADPGQRVRIGSGEFSDSLSLEPLTGFARLLVPFLRPFPNVLFEFKTKSDLVDNLLDLEPQGRAMVSWSISPEAVVRREEHKTASLTARLRAARRCWQAGYQIGLHFDPLLHYPGWEADYEGLVDEVFKYLDPGAITTLSMGSLRFAPALKPVVRSRFPKSRIMAAELFPGADGKMRYFKPLRIEMYRHLIACLQRYIDPERVYLCMESQEVWQQVFGHAPACHLDVERRIQGGTLGPSRPALIPLNSLVT
jgi:spore photoproduct lyase